MPEGESTSNVRAVCPHGIIVSPYRVQGVLHYRVSVLFFRNQAWTKDTSSHVLSHEQLHFDIAELCARRIRKSIDEISRQSSQSIKYRMAIEELLAKEGIEQDNYDRETAHGVYTRRQMEWAKKIAEELDCLKEFASDSLRIK